MPEDPWKARAGEAAPAGIFLEIRLKEGEAPLEVPVIVENLSLALLTLEILRLPQALDWGQLSQRPLNLRLKLPGHGEGLILPGRVAWTRPALGSGVSLGLELARITGEVRKFLEAQILHSPRDIKEFWGRWDRFRESPVRQLLQHRIYLAGLGLVAGGLSLRLLGPGALDWPGLVFILLGFMAIGGKALETLWQKHLNWH